MCVNFKQEPRAANPPSARSTNARRCAVLTAASGKPRATTHSRWKRNPSAHSAKKSGARPLRTWASTARMRMPTHKHHSWTSSSKNAERCSASSRSRAASAFWHSVGYRFEGVLQERTHASCLGAAGAVEIAEGGITRHRTSVGFARALVEQGHQLSIPDFAAPRQFIFRFLRQFRSGTSDFIHASDERSAASSSAESSPRGNRWPYTSIVIMMDEWPRRS